MVLSGLAGSISLACWIIVFTPQIYENWLRQSTEGLSLAFVVIWLLGDLFNVFGALLQHVLPTMTLLAVYYTAADIVLLFQCLIYKHHHRARAVVAADAEQQQPLLQSPAASPAASPVPASSAVSKPRAVLHHYARQPVIKESLIVLVVILCGVLGYVLGDHEQPDTPGVPPEPQPLSFWGQVLGWICAGLYLASRLPQIHLNYKRKSTDGVAVLFFVFTLLGNITYCLSIFAADSSRHALVLNASWIVGAFGSLLLDIVVVVQFWVYR